MKKLILILTFICCFALPVLAQGNTPDSQSAKPVLPSQIGQVEAIETFGNITPSPEGELKEVKQSVDVKILTGPHKGDKAIIENVLMGNPAYDIKLKKGDKVILHVEQSDDGGVNYFIADKQRVPTLYWLAGLFFGLLLIIGGKRGFFSLISILITLGLIFWALTPLLLSGMSPVLATVLVCVFAAVIAIYLVGGFNSKSTAAILGTVSSLIIAGLLSILSIKGASLTGFSSEESMFLFTAHPDLDFVITF